MVFPVAKYWGIWIGIVCLMILAILPWPIQYVLAQLLGNLAFNSMKSRRVTTLRNLEVCFPEWSEAEVHENARRSLCRSNAGRI